MLAFLLSAHVFGEVSFYRTLKTFPIFVAFSSILARWSVVVSILALLGYTTELYLLFSKPVLLAWILSMPFVLLAAQISAWKIVYYVVSRSADQKRRDWANR